VKIGADEDFELSKITLSLKGYEFYSQVWNDQPLLYTWLATKVAKHFESLLALRLVTSVFAAVLIASIFVIALRVNGLLVATLSALLVIVSPGFVELSGSCMLEIPALAPAMAALTALVGGPHSKVRLITAGMLFAISFQIKLINIILLPLVMLLICLDARKPLDVKELLIALSVFGTSLAFSFVTVGVLIGGESFWLQFEQAWQSHFGGTKSFEYGSPADRSFDWGVYGRNWDTTGPALLGLVVSASQTSRTKLAALPLAWFALELAVFGTRKPWWTYYYIHNAIPICWCAAIGIGAAVERLKSKRQIPAIAVFIVFAITAGAWAAGRVYLQVAEVRRSPKVYGSLALKEIERFKPFVKFIYADEPVYSFHSGIPMPPKLGILPLKRFWSGEMTNARLVEELMAARPELILISVRAGDLPFARWLTTEYNLVSEDDKHRLYAHKTIADKAVY
jgi:hypothetical protein